MNTHLKIKRFVKLTALILSAGFMFSCKHKDDKELEQLQSSGVMLIQNKGYYEVELPNGTSIYFSSYNSKDGIEDLAFHPDSVELQKSYGTGFFVGHDGMIVTNNHVVSASLEDKDIKNPSATFSIP